MRGDICMTNTIFAKDTSKELSKPSKMRVAIYCRLSKDDERDGESESIQNQKVMLKRYCKESGFEVMGVYQDDGYTGLNMNRPDLNRMFSAIEQGQVDIVLTKDMSRLSRDYVNMGRLVEEYFPKHRIRYISLNDNIDSTNSVSATFMPIQAVINQMYSLDTSRKVHAAYLSKAKEGKFTGVIAPFGYRKFDNDKNKLEIDEETAWIVKLIYEYAKEGHGANYIRRRLEEKEIPCPAWWNRERGLRNKFTKFELENPEYGRFVWDFCTIKKILMNPVYIGAISSQKREYKFKVGWIKDKEPHEWMIVEDMHEPLISREDFELVQEKVKNRKRPDSSGSYSIFAGLVKCGQCGSSLNIRRAKQETKSSMYTCSKYNKYGVKHCSQHRMKYDVLYSLVLERIRSYATKSLEDKDEVIAQLKKQNKHQSNSERAFVEKSIRKDIQELSKIERVIAKLYYDLADERISEENFNNILSKNQEKQNILKKRIENNQNRFNIETQEQGINEKWSELIKECADIQELDTSILQRLIKKIVIHEDFDGDVVHQTVEIHFNFIEQPDKHQIVRKRNINSIII